MKILTLVDEKFIRMTEIEKIRKRTKILGQKENYYSW
eukprot:UN15634